MGKKEVRRVKEIEEEGRKVETAIKEAGGAAALAHDEARLIEIIGGTVLICCTACKL